MKKFQKTSQNYLHLLLIALLMIQRTYNKFYNDKVQTHNDEDEQYLRKNPIDRRENGWLFEKDDAPNKYIYLIIKGEIDGDLENFLNEESNHVVTLNFFFLEVEFTGQLDIDNMKIFETIKIKIENINNNSENKNYDIVCYNYVFRVLQNKTDLKLDYHNTLSECINHSIDSKLINYKLTNILEVIYYKVNDETSFLFMIVVIFMEIEGITINEGLEETKNSFKGDFNMNLFYLSSDHTITSSGRNKNLKDIELQQEIKLDNNSLKILFEKNYLEPNFRFENLEPLLLTDESEFGFFISNLKFEDKSICLMPSLIILPNTEELFELTVFLIFENETGIKHFKFLVFTGMNLVYPSEYGFVYSNEGDLPLFGIKAYILDDPNSNLRIKIQLFYGKNDEVKTIDDRLTSIKMRKELLDLKKIPDFKLITKNRYQEIIKLEEEKSELEKKELDQITSLTGELEKVKIEINNLEQTKEDQSQTLKLKTEKLTTIESELAKVKNEFTSYKDKNSPVLKCVITGIITFIFTSAIFAIYLFLKRDSSQTDSDVQVEMLQPQSH